MAQSHKFKSLDDLTAFFPDVPWKASASKVWVYDKKAEEYVEVTKGDYVVSIGDRYEVSEEEPDNAKPAKKAEVKDEPKADEAEAKPNASVSSESIESGVATKTNE